MARPSPFFKRRVEQGNGAALYAESSVGTPTARTGYHAAGHID